jgi:hypothetical protein
MQIMQEQLPAVVRGFEFYSGDPCELCELCERYFLSVPPARVADFAHLGLDPVLRLLQYLFRFPVFSVNERADREHYLARP